MVSGIRTRTTSAWQALVGLRCPCTGVTGVVRGRTVSKKQLAFAQGRVEGVRESGWQCGDCGNFYDATVDYCPNRLLDQALLDQSRAEQVRQGRKRARDAFGYLAPERTADGKAIVVGPFETRAEAEAAAEGNPIVDMPGYVPVEDVPYGASGRREHLGGCPCEEGSCCPWMGDCDCQCRCDLIAAVEQRVRAESDSSGAYQRGYDAAVSEFAAEHAAGGRLLRVGYEQALKDVVDKAAGSPEGALEVAQGLLEELGKYGS